MKISKNTLLSDIFHEYPFIKEELIKLKPEFKILNNKLLFQTIKGKATLEKASEMGNIEIGKLFSVIKNAIREKTGADIEVETENSEIKNDKVEKLKNIIKDLHKTEDIESAKKSFNKLVDSLDPGELVKMEETLIQEGMPVTEIQRLCDVHHALVHDKLENQVPQVRAGHPVNTYIRENEEISKIADSVGKISSQLAKGSKKEQKTLLEKFKKEIIELQKVNNHYVRKENQLFPFLEKKGITGPPKVMWGIHDEVRKEIKILLNSINEEDVDTISETIPSLVRTIVEMIAKENSILFPMALKALDEREWHEIRKGEDSIGYEFFEPDTSWLDEREEINGDRTGTNNNGKIQMNTGILTAQQINRILTTIPIDITFVDENDEVKYFTDSEHRIFPRSPGIIGRKVENCHPAKSVYMVKKILQEFKNGSKDKAEFWIHLGEQYVHIRYFAVRDDNGSYMGTLEFSQEIGEIQKINGDKRLLDWED
jgi:DUF438 domain-containing protein